MIILQLTQEEISLMIEAAVGKALASLTPTKPREIIKRQECMKRLSISEPTIIEWGKKKKIPELRIGKAVRYDWDAVNEALSK